MEIGKQKYNGKDLMRKAEEFCVFCEIILQNDNLLYQDEQIVVFKDRDQASSKLHLLVCPKKHIVDVNSLDKTDLDLLQLMEKVGIETVQKYFPNKEYRFGFHKPPLISVDHLHLHCFVLPIQNDFINLVKYGKLLHSVDTIRSDILQKKKNQF